MRQVIASEHKYWARKQHPLKIWVINATVMKASQNREMAGGESENSEDKGLKNEGFAASLGDVFTLPNGGERYIDAHGRGEDACVLPHHERRGKLDRRGGLIRRRRAAAAGTTTTGLSAVNNKPRRSHGLTDGWTNRQASISDDRKQLGYFPNLSFAVCKLRCCSPPPPLFGRRR